MSMAIRLDHALGCPGYYDQMAEIGLDTSGITHTQRLEMTLKDMRRLYEEVSGYGFYKPELEADYVATMNTALPDINAEGEG